MGVGKGPKAKNEAGELGRGCTQMLRLSVSWDSAPVSKVSLCKRLNREFAATELQRLSCIQGCQSLLCFRSSTPNKTRLLRQRLEFCI